MDFNRMINGMIRAAQLDRSFYQLVERDTSYSRDSLNVVILVALIGGLGSFFASVFAGNIGGAILGFILAVVWAVIAFYLWAGLVYFVGTNLFKGQGDFGEVQRCLGFAYAPQALNIFSFIPCIGPLVSLVAWIWSLATGYVAIQEALDQDNTNAILTIAVAVVIVIILTVIWGLIMAALGLAGAAIGGLLGQ